MTSATLELIDTDLVIVEERSAKVGVLGYALRAPRGVFRAGETIEYHTMRPRFDEPYLVIEKNGQHYKAFLEIYATARIKKEMDEQ